MSDFNREEEYLEHYGVKGMKWHKHLKAATEWWKYGDANNRGQLMRSAQVTRLQGNNVSPMASKRQRSQLAAKKRAQAIAQAPSKKVGNAIRSAGNTLDSVRSRTAGVTSNVAKKVSSTAKKASKAANKKLNEIEAKRKSEGKSTRESIKWNLNYHKSKLKRKAQRGLERLENTKPAKAVKKAADTVGRKVTGSTYKKAYERATGEYDRAWRSSSSNIHNAKVSKNLFARDVVSPKYRKMSRETLKSELGKTVKSVSDGVKAAKSMKDNTNNRNQAFIPKTANRIKKYFSKEERNYRAAKKKLRKVNLTGDGPALSSERGGVLKRTAKGIGRSVSSIGKNAARTAAGASKKLSKGASKALNRLTSGASKFGKNVSSKASSARKSAAKTASKAKKGAASTFKNLASGASKLGKGMGSRASSIRKSAGSAASKARKSIASGASNARKSISSIKSRNKKNAAKPKERQVRKDGATNITSNPKKKSIASTFKNLTSGIGKKKKKTSSWSKTYSESKKASKKRKRTSNPKKKSIASTFKNLTSGFGKKKKTSSWSKTYSESKKASKKRKRSGKFPWSR